MASTSEKHDLEPVNGRESKSKKPRINDTAGSDSSNLQLPNKRVVLNPADCNLDFTIENDGLKGSALHEGAFAHCWSGARANIGISGGKYCFGCKIISAQPVEMESTRPHKQHVCRVGISRGDDAVGKLGETRHSFIFGGTGNFSQAQCSNYAEKFGFLVGDTIVCAVDLERKPMASIRFYKNGKWSGFGKILDAGQTGLGVVNSNTKQPQWKSALFPHVLLKNVVVQLQFSVEDGLVPVRRFKPWDSALDDGNAVFGPLCSDVRDCEVRMMVGLPASGKSTWAETWAKKHPEKRYVLLGTNLVLDQMRVDLLYHYGEEYDSLMGRANAIFEILLSRAPQTPRNYIIDQNNVFKSARERILRPFSNFQKIAVVVFPKPLELEFRADKRYKGMWKGVPSDAVKNMLANYALPMSMDMPGSDESFDQVIFPELGEAECQRYLEEMKNALTTDSTPGGRTDSYQRFGAVNPCSRPSLNGKNNAVGAATPFDSCRSNVVEPPPAYEEFPAAFRGK